MTRLRGPDVTLSIEAVLTMAVALQERLANDSDCFCAELQGLCFTCMGVKALEEVNEEGIPMKIPLKKKKT